MYRFVISKDNGRYQSRPLSPIQTLKELGAPPLLAATLSRLGIGESMPYGAFTVTRVSGA